MKIAFMQPYLFPYIGYFQLINSVDYFGIGDDVQFIRGGWINRNRILSSAGPKMFTFPLKRESHKEIIKNRYFHESFLKEKQKFLRILQQNYSKAPHYSSTFDLVMETMDSSDLNVSKFICKSLKILCERLDIQTEFLESNVWQYNIKDGENAQEKVLNKLNSLGELRIKQLINPIGGSNLYDKAFFRKHQYKLLFLKTNEIKYQQFNADFIPNLSIIDVMMFNSVDKVKKMLHDYELI